MPPTEQSVISQQVYINKTNIENLEKAVGRIETSIKELTNHYSNRPTWGILLAITTLASTVAILAQYIITHGG